MKNIRKRLLLPLSLLLLLTGCSSIANQKREDAFQYKGSLIGDNSAVIHIIEQLPYAEKFHEVSLETKTQPYGMTIMYEKIDTVMTEREYEEAAVYNASYLFTLIDNAEWVAFDFEGHSYKMSRSKLEDWYGKELHDVTNENELETFIQRALEQESALHQLFIK
ncbi:DUF4825 domain-containing protein [Sporosarcina ureae]|uniref:DUF4825 domain-containing protein n=1 Tax=Sporosarcina ureae TaxID=1571 RepID=UPI0026EF65E2|nr:DUF4825 domain-containing protein [Sporosarcina ureae]